MKTPWKHHGKPHGSTMGVNGSTIEMKNHSMEVHGSIMKAHTIALKAPMGGIMGATWKFLKLP